VYDHFGDRLAQAIQEKDAPACVGLDPLIDRLPAALLEEYGLPGTLGQDKCSTATTGSKVYAEAILAFGRAVIETIAKSVPVVKINIAFFERYYADGVRAYGKLVRYAQDHGLLVIGDVKRADIGHSTTQYARAQLDVMAQPDVGEIATPDAVTVNPYFGFDGIRPFVEIARDTGRGLFVLVQTSNESAAEVQGLTLTDGMKVCERIGTLVQGWAGQSELVGKKGYSCIGAVVSPRDLASTERIRSLMPNCVFLVPGFGAQGRTTDEVAKCFKPDGTDAFVTASRSVIYAYNDARYADAHGDDWRRCIEHGCLDFVDAIRSVTSS
jgi:orotidine-5'-phosphate decarboxylase